MLFAAPWPVSVSYKRSITRLLRDCLNPKLLIAAFDKLSSNGITKLLKYFVSISKIKKKFLVLKHFTL